jgi:serine protease Do
MERLVTDGKITRGYLGVTLQAITPELAEAFQLDTTSGALVGGVQPGTPAAKSGMQDGDVIIEFNGKKVTDWAHLRIMVAQTPPKTAVKFKALRDGKEKTFDVTLAELPEDLSVRQGEDPSSDVAEASSPSLDGVEVAELDGQIRRQYNIPTRIRGALVTTVDDDSKAAEAGLRPGDVIVEINRRPVRTADDAVELTRAVKGKNILLRVYSQSGGVGGTRFLTVEAAPK